MKNLMYCCDTCSKSMSIAMASGLHALSLSWLDIHCPYSTSSADRICLLHPMNVNDPVLESIFQGSITFYSTIFIKEVRFTTAEYACGKRSDNSNFIFKADANESFGKIRRILKVNDSEPIFYVGIVPHLVPIGTSIESDVLVNVNDIIEKCVLYERLIGSVTFDRFPNLQESSWVSLDRLFLWTTLRFSQAAHSHCKSSFFISRHT